MEKKTATKDSDIKSKNLMTHTKTKFFLQYLYCSFSSAPIS